jgi:dethiobiotin synthetase
MGDAVLMRRFDEVARLASSIAGNATFFCPSQADPWLHGGMAKNGVVFVTGTDTGVGKTLLATLLARALSDRGTDVAALKPLCSGDRKDAEMLRAAAGNVISLDEVNPWWFRAPLTPLLAARREGRRVRLAEVLVHVRAMRRRFSMVLLEGAGGLLSPLGKDFDALDLIVRLEARVLVVSVNRLGVVNQVLLTLRALPRDIAQDARVVLMTARRPDYSSRSNVRLLRELVEPGRVEVLPWLTAGQRRGGATLKLGARRALGRLTRYALGRGRAPARP